MRLVLSVFFFNIQNERTIKVLEYHSSLQKHKRNITLICVIPEYRQGLKSKRCFEWIKANLISRAYIARYPLFKGFTSLENTGKKLKTVGEGKRWRLLGNILLSSSIRVSLSCSCVLGNWRSKIVSKVYRLNAYWSAEVSEAIACWETSLGTSCICLNFIHFSGSACGACRLLMLGLRWWAHSLKTHLKGGVDERHPARSSPGRIF